MKKNPPFFIFGSSPSILTRGRAQNLASLLVGEPIDPSSDPPKPPTDLDKTLRDVAQHGEEIRRELEEEIAGSK